jgi:hypothetical protein
MSAVLPVGPGEPGTAIFRAEALAQTSGRIRLEVEGKPGAVLEVRNGQVGLKDDDGEPVDAVIACDQKDEADVRRMLLGSFNPIVAVLRARFEIKQNPELVTTVLLGVQHSSGRSTARQEA